MLRPQSPEYVEYWGSLRPCLATISGALATRPVPPSPLGPELRDHHEDDREEEQHDHSSDEDEAIHLGV
jgi:hypothetical protein